METTYIIWLVPNGQQMHFARGIRDNCGEVGRYQTIDEVREAFALIAEAHYEDSYYYEEFRAMRSGEDEDAYFAEKDRFDEERRAACAKQAAEDLWFDYDLKHFYAVELTEDDDFNVVSERNLSLGE